MKCPNCQSDNSESARFCANCAMLLTGGHLRRDDRFKPVLEKFRKAFETWMGVLAQVRSRGELPNFFDAPLSDLLKKLDIKL